MVFDKTGTLTAVRRYRHRVLPGGWAGETGEIDDWVPD
jgi:hypothetical protein